jgi:hypothetical protein
MNYDRKIEDIKMQKEYYSKNGLWLIISVTIIYAVTIYYIFDEGNNTFLEYLPFIIILILNTLMLVFYGRELFSKKPLLVLEEKQLIYRGMFKTYVILYDDIKNIRKTDNGSKRRKQTTRIGIEFIEDRNPVFIIVQSIDYDAEKLFNNMLAIIFKKEK